MTQSRAYGAANPALTEVITGFANGETDRGCDRRRRRAPTTTGGDRRSGCRTAYPITCALGTLASTTTGSCSRRVPWTVTQATLTVTADDDSRAYGPPAASAGLTATITGFANGETLLTSDVTGTAACTDTTGATDAPGVYGDAITCAVGTLASTNYSFVFAAGDMEITQATLTVTADDESRAYGPPAASAGLTATITGFANGETLLTSDVTGTAACTDTTGATDAPGVYGDAITCAVGTLASTNYSFVFAAGDMEITQATLTVTADAGQSKVYGNADPTLTYTITSGSLVHGDTFAGALHRAAG